MYIMALVIVLLIILLMFISIIINYKNRIHVEKLYTEKEIEYQNYKKQYKKITDNNKKLKFLRHDLVKHMSVTDALSKENDVLDDEDVVYDDKGMIDGIVECDDKGMIDGIVECDENVACDETTASDKNVVWDENGVFDETTASDETALYDEEDVYDLEVRSRKVDCSDILKIINIIVSQKRDIAEKNGIIFKAEIENFGVEISEPDIVGLISNLLDNAIEACVDIKGNPKIELNINERSICVTNSIILTRKYKSSFFETSKKDKEMHGYGMKIINNIVNKYNGLILAKECRNIFKIKIKFI